MASFNEKLNAIVTSKGYKNFMAKLYGLGAAVVIIGALFKINHYPLADVMLIAGMGTEAIIFIFSAFEPPHQDVNWSIVFPELGEGGDPHGAGTKMPVKTQAKEEETRLLGEKIDDLLKAAKMDVSLFENLHNSINKLTSVADNMSSTMEVVKVNSNYSEEVSKLTQRLAGLNELYAKQLEASAMQIEATTKAQESMNKIADTLSGTLDSSTNYRDEIVDLSNKVKSLNKIYSDMLNALSNIGKA